MARRTTWAPPSTPFTLTNVAPLGVTRSAMRVAEASGRVFRLTHGVYIASDAVPADPTDRHLLQALALQVGRPHLVASDNTAALAWGLPLDDPAASTAGPPHFLEPTSVPARSEQRGAARVRVGAIPRHHRVQHPSGLVVTSVARTAVDVASRARLPEALIPLDAAARLALEQRVGTRRMREHYTRPSSLDAALHDLREAVSVAGTHLTRARLTRAIDLTDPRRESPLESFSFGEFALAGLPMPTPQARIDTDLGSVYVDDLWPEQRVIGEADGMFKYDDPTALRREKLRQESLERMGFLVVRWDYAEIRRTPWRVVARIEQAIARRS